MNIQKSYKKNTEQVLSELKNALNGINPEQMEDLINMMDKSDKIFFIGVGRVLLSLQAIAKRLKHIGYDTYIVGETTEPPFTNKDLLIVGSGSGSTAYPASMAKKAKEIGGNIAHIGANPDNPLKDITDVFVRIPVKSKKDLPDQVDSSQPMTSLFEQSLLLFGDIMTLVILEMKNHYLDDSLWSNHATLE